MTPGDQMLLRALLSVTVAAAVTLTAVPSSAADFVKPPLAPTPPMGWNSYNSFDCDIDEQLIRDTADAMVSSGMREAGYEYVNIDDCWMAPERDADGNLQADPERFPGGIRALADYVHARGLKLGIYSSAGTATCQGLPASLGHEEADASVFAQWRVDLLKYDNCNNQGLPAADRYRAMAEALAASGRDIVLSISGWGSDRPWESFGPELGHYWKTVGAINDSWSSVMDILDQQVGLEKYSGPNGWNDPDMLEVGNPGLTFEESRAHMSLWALLNAPLIAGNDLRDMPASTLRLLTNPRVIAVNQDWGGIQGHKITDNGDQEVWVKPMSDGGAAVVLLNRSATVSSVSTSAADLGLGGSRAYRIEDLWSGDLTETSGAVRAEVPAHGVRMFMVTKSRPRHADPAISVIVTASDDGVVAPGSSFTARVTVTNDGFTPARDTRVTFTAPDGWDVEETGGERPDVVPPGGSVARTYEVAVPEHLATGMYPLETGISYTVRGRHKGITAPRSLGVATAPHGAVSLSDLDPLRYEVGRGDLGLDESPGGNRITIDGTGHDKGVAAHAASEVVYYVGGECSAFRAVVGIDDEVGDNGAVTFAVLGDGEVLAETGIVRGADPAVTVNADLTGVGTLTLVTGAGPGWDETNDHSEWADARIECANPR